MRGLFIYNNKMSKIIYKSRIPKDKNQVESTSFA